MFSVRRSKVEEVAFDVRRSTFGPIAPQHWRSTGPFVVRDSRPVLLSMICKSSAARHGGSLRRSASVAGSLRAKPGGLLNSGSALLCTMQPDGGYGQTVIASLESRIRHVERCLYDLRPSIFDLSRAECAPPPLSPAPGRVCARRSTRKAAEEAEEAEVTV